MLTLWDDVIAGAAGAADLLEREKAGKVAERYNMLEAAVSFAIGPSGERIVSLALRTVEDKKTRPAAAAA